MNDTTSIIEEPEFRQWLLFYRVYRHMSAILLLLGQLVIGKRYGNGWKLFYDYEMKQNNSSEYE